MTRRDEETMEDVKNVLRTLCEALGGELTERDDVLTCKVSLSNDKEIHVEARTRRKSSICSLVDKFRKVAPDEVGIPGIAKWRLRERVEE